MNEWISVDEKLPKEGEMVIAAKKGHTWSCGMFRGTAGRYWQWKNNTLKEFDYWMPKKGALPELPRSDSDD